MNMETKIGWGVIGTIAAIGVVSAVQSITVEPGYGGCGRVPKSTDSQSYICNWFECACALAENRGVCCAKYFGWITAVDRDVYNETGKWPYLMEHDHYLVGDDYVRVTMGNPAVDIGTFKWKCEGE